MSRPPNNTDFLELLGKAGMRVLKHNLEPFLRELAEEPEGEAEPVAKAADVVTTGEETAQPLTDEEIEERVKAYRDGLRKREVL